MAKAPPPAVDQRTDQIPLIPVGGDLDSLALPHHPTAHAMISVELQDHEDRLNGLEGLVPPAQGPQGPQGPPGATGPTGPAGPQGQPGPTGPPGTNGQDGGQGPIGLPGPPGMQGPRGPTGPQGPEGNGGRDGVDGVDGADGPPGPQGPQGDQALATIVVGTFGRQTTPNDLPPDGLIPEDWDGPGAPPADLQLIAGESLIYSHAPPADPNWSHVYSFVGSPIEDWVDLGRLQGADGAQGIQGPEGPQGIEGPEGPQGIQGFPGAQGPDGPEGPEGPEGPPGLDGADGIATTIVGDFGRITTPVDLPPGAGGQASIPVDWDGPGQPGVAYVVRIGEALVYSHAPDADPAKGHLFVYVEPGWTDVGLTQGPVGPPGPQGDQGDEGPEGPQGPPSAGYVVAQPLPPDPMAPNISPPDGLLWVDESRQPVWNDYLIPGPPGADGVDGAVGAQGPQGIQGPQGPQGPQGIQGVPGPPGAAGGLGAWVNIPFSAQNPAWTGSLQCRTENGGGTVRLRGEYGTGPAWPAGWRDLGTIPAGYRPGRGMHFPAAAQGSTNAAYAILDINSQGAVRIATVGGSTSGYLDGITYDI